MFYKWKSKVCGPNKISLKSWNSQKFQYKGKDIWRVPKPIVTGFLLKHISSNSILGQYLQYIYVMVWNRIGPNKKSFMKRYQKNLGIFLVWPWVIFNKNILFCLYLLRIFKKCFILMQNECHIHICAPLYAYSTPLWILLITKIKWI